MSWQENSENKWMDLAFGCRQNRGSWTLDSKVTSVNNSNNDAAANDKDADNDDAADDVYILGVHVSSEIKDVQH